MMSSLSQILGVGTSSRVSVIGCGGKTSVIQRIAEENSNKSVLITPTTKIFYPQHSERVITGESDCLNYKACRGIQYMGEYNQADMKLRALDLEVLNAVESKYDLVLMEADGSKGLPLKGWAEYEPVIPEFTTHTIGIVTLLGLNQRATEESVHRLSLFTELTGLMEGEAVTIEAIAAMICRPSGMFQKAKGQRVLIVNQADSENSRDTAALLCGKIIKMDSGRIHQYIIGSAKFDRWMEFRD